MGLHFIMIPSLSISYRINSPYFVNTIQLAGNFTVVKPFDKLSELPNRHIKGQWIRIFVEEVSYGWYLCRYLLWVHVAINCLYYTSYHIFLSHFATERRAFWEIIIQPSLHSSPLIDSNHRFVNQEAASSPCQLRKAFQAYFIQMQTIWVRDMLNINQPDRYSLQIQRLLVMRRTKLLSYFRLEIVGRDKQRIPSSQFVHLPLLLHLWLILRVYLVLLNPESGLFPVLPDLAIWQFLYGLPVFLDELFIID